MPLGPGIFISLFYHGLCHTNQQPLLFSRWIEVRSRQAGTRNIPFSNLMLLHLRRTRWGIAVWLLFGQSFPNLWLFPYDTTREVCELAEQCNNISLLLMTVMFAGVGRVDVESSTAACQR